MAVWHASAAGSKTMVALTLPATHPGRAEKQPNWAVAEEDVGAVGELLGEQAAGPDADIAGAMAAGEQTAAAAAAAPAKVRRRGTLAQEEIFDIVFDRKRSEGTIGPAVPAGLPSRYSALVDAKDAPQV